MRFSLRKSINVLPLDPTMRDVAPPVIPDWLEQSLFAPDETKQMKAYALIDAAAVTNLVPLLNTSDLQYACLFSGSAAQDLQDVAPWLVQLTWSESFTRNLFIKSDAAWHFFGLTALQFIRSPDTLDGLRRRLRRITKVTDADGKRFYFRFWEGSNLFDHLSLTPIGTSGAVLTKAETLMFFDHSPEGSLLNMASYND